jgi:hypothetical protein
VDHDRAAQTVLRVRCIGSRKRHGWITGRAPLKTGYRRRYLPTVVPLNELGLLLERQLVECDESRLEHLAESDAAVARDTHALVQDVGHVRDIVQETDIEPEARLLPPTSEFKDRFLVSRR